MNIIWQKPDGTLAVTLMAKEALRAMRWAHDNRQWLDSRAVTEARVAEIKESLGAYTPLDEDATPDQIAAVNANRDAEMESLAAREQELRWADEVAFIEANVGADIEAHARLLKARGNIPADWWPVAYDVAIPESRVFRGAWRADNGAVTEDLDAARVIAHQRRRERREAEFSPLDDAIAKRLPGVDEAVIEAQRQAVRDKYAAIQAAIDSAADVAALRQVDELSKEASQI